MARDHESTAASIDAMFASIPGGTFDYGDLVGEGWPDERPARRCEMRPFAIARIATTTRQYLEFLQADGQTEAGIRGLYRLSAESASGLGPGPNRDLRCAPGREDHPAVYVSWHGANAFCEWLSRDLGYRVRLPTEAEWQYAASGPEGWRWALGDVFERSAYVCNVGETAPVAHGHPSPFGLFNMTGNVFEWCQDRYHVPPGSPRPRIELDGSRLIKGGAFSLRDADSLRNARRFSCAEASCLDCVGFRVVRDAPAIAQGA